MIEERLILELPLDRLGLAVLRDFEETKQWSDYNYVNEARNAGYSEDAKLALSEAMSWLRGRGLLAPDLLQSNTGAFVTRLGRSVLESGLTYLYATERLQEGLHPVIEGEARSQFLLEEYELAVFASMKAVEVRVRKLSGYSDDEHGVLLMNHAFGKSGPLRDVDATEGEQEGMRALFAGAYAVLRNPTGHREVDYDDPAEAADAVQVASLLMRILDRVKERQN
jgi:uncharacterized protein (TIGR02391 family)